jgi:hypothetical protein
MGHGVSVYEDVRTRIRADLAYADQFPNDETIQGARAEIVADFLEVAERWRLKAQEWGPEEKFVALREMVCQEVLDILHAHLWDEGED